MDPDIKISLCADHDATIFLDVRLEESDGSIWLEMSKDDWDDDLWLAVDATEPAVRQFANDLLALCDSLRAS